MRPNFPIQEDFSMKQMKMALASLLVCAVGSIAQNWAGILDSSRAIDWGRAGVEGGIPNRTTIYATLNPGATVADINAAIAACPNDQVVYLNAGTYNLTAGIVMKSRVTLRGAGADKTFLIFTGTNACFGAWSVVCFGAETHVWGGDADALPGGTNAAVWTAGFAKGTTQITLTNVGSSGLAVGQYIILDQANVTADNGELFVCDNTTTPCSLEGGNGGRVMGGVQHGQTQVVKITAINGSTYTVTPGLYAPNWNGSLQTGAWWVRMIQSAGLENLSVDHNNAGEVNGISMYGANNCWVKGVRSLNSNRNHVQLCASAHNTVEDCYFYGTQNGVSQSYGVEVYLGSDNLIVNNLFQRVTCPQMLQLAVGNVVAYNFSINDYEVASADFLYGSVADHNEGNEYNLLEGNNGAAYGADLFHGTSGMTTLFRNRYTGWEAGKGNNLIAIRIDSYKRYYNLIGNVLGTFGVTSKYDSGYVWGHGMVYSLGGGNSNGTVTIPSDPLVVSTTMRWGNYDVLNKANRFTPSEVPHGLSKYANPVPADSNLPASFYLAAKPGWWPTAKAWPPIGPDVTGGNLANLDGRAYTIFAQDCYDSVMHGPADGSGNPLPFNASNCYGTGISVETAPVIDNNTTLSAFPNPFHSSVLFSFPNPRKSARVDIYTVDGRKVMTLADIKSDKAEWRPDHLTPRIYAVELRADGRIFRQRICLIK